MKEDPPRTMEAFARACGVSRPTLSKFFEDPESVKPSTRALITAKLEETDYQPNLYARNLNRKRTRTIGIVVPAITDPFYAQLVTRLELLLRAEGYWPLTISPHGQPDLEVEALRTLQSLRVGGALIAPLGFASDAEAMQRFVEATPCIFLDNAIGGMASFVGNDNRQSIGTMVDYLCRSGEAPVYINTPPVNPGTGERCAAYLAAMCAHGATPLVLESQTETPWDLERVGFERMQALIAAGLPGRTLLCANDRLAFGVIAAAHEAGLRVGHGEGYDLRVAGHDDHPLSRYSAPSLTTIAQDYEGISRTASAHLLALLSGETPRGTVSSTQLPAKLVMRASA
ncbi:LacI family DNA-binding transcriptional regulator [Salipiger marinus]|uniref:Transcriptional regulator, LacI family n=1 Tax=Salipiger marinus TaxID=555512 RepID=A0A1G8LZZ7_9RHOB|nr:LacI family DNA-binding transcriptional regulator [Salipiger marinus]SDI61203.1 transcriptional regulator, LacI family [Salipiger marinus]